jgi:UDP-N-acetylglucosamine acyltransferase
MKTVDIHPTAIVEKSVELDEGVSVGAFSILRGKCMVGRNTKIQSHVVMGSEHGVVIMGKNNVVHPGAIVGGPPQDLKFKGEQTSLEIGDDNIIREFATLNCGTATGGGVTKVGNNNLLMAYTHIAHDCLLHNNIAIANTSQLAGHVTVEDSVRIGGMCVFNQFITVGKNSFVTGDSACNKDIMPFTIAQGNHAVSRAANSIGLERAGFPTDEVENVRRAIRIVTKGTRTIDEALAEIATACRPSENITYLVNFIRKSERGVAR